jgi:hypothetical protein
MIEGSRSGSGSGSGSGSIPLTNGPVSGSRRPKNMWIWWIRIRIRNTGYKLLASCATGLIHNKSPASLVTITVISSWPPVPQGLCLTRLLIRIQAAQKTYGSFGSCSGSATLAENTDYWIFQVRAAPVMREIVVPEGWGPG